MFDCLPSSQLQKNHVNIDQLDMPLAAQLTAGTRVKSNVLPQRHLHPRTLKECDLILPVDFSM